MRFSALLLSVAFCACMLSAQAQEESSLSLACAVQKNRSNWISVMEGTETRWGLSVEAQLSLFAEDWQLEADNLPSRWRPDWTIFSRPEPGIPAGYFDATWTRYKFEANNPHARTNDFSDISDFMGWYFASASEFAQFAPGDAAAFYIVWRRGPDYYQSGAWQSNTGLIYRSHTFAQRAAQISEDLQTCDLQIEGETSSPHSEEHFPTSAADNRTAPEPTDGYQRNRFSRVIRPWTWVGTPD